MNDNYDGDGFKTVMDEAKYRLDIKKVLREHDVPFDKMAKTLELEKLKNMVVIV